MKGVIFTGFIDWVRTQHGEDFVDDILDASELSTDGAYTAVGNYPYIELLVLADAVALRTGSTQDDILRDFARESFMALAEGHQFLLMGIDDALRLLEVTESHIHVEVLKLYPDTKLPTIETRRLPDGSMELEYSSDEPLARMCEGRILGTLDLFEAPYDVSTVVLDESRCRATFRIAPRAAA